ncbi:Calpain clp-1, partial [Brachionus plicatilis]
MFVRWFGTVRVGRWFGSAGTVSTVGLVQFGKFRWYGWYGSARTADTVRLVQLVRLVRFGAAVGSVLGRDPRGHVVFEIPTADPNVREARLPSGLVRGHAYTLTKVEEYDGNKLLRIRNPWGNEVEWNGAWSDNSSEWESLSESDRLDAGLIKVFDGEFWMCFEDFLEHWDSLQICHMTPESFSENLLENESDNNNLEWHCTYFQSEWIRGK